MTEHGFWRQEASGFDSVFKQKDSPAFVLKLRFFRVLREIQMLYLELFAPENFKLVGLNASVVVEWILVVRQV